MPRKLLLVALPLLALALLGGGWFALSGPGRELPAFLAGDADSRPRPQPVSDATGAADTAGNPAADAAEGTKDEAREAGGQTTGDKRTELEGGKDDPAATSTPANPAGGAQPETRKPRRGAGRRNREAARNRDPGITPPPQSWGEHRPQPRKLAEEVGKRPLEEATPKLRQDRRGLLARYYSFDLNPLEVLADASQPGLDQRSPSLTRIDTQVHFPSKQAWSDLAFDLGNFMAVWEGFLVVDKPGDYWLFLGTDLQGRVVLSGETVLLNDFAMDYVEVSTVLTLSEGLHPLRIEYLEARNGSVVEALGSCNFMYVPDGATTAVAVPPEMLLVPKALWSDEAPIITQLSPAKAAIGDEITISGQNLGTTALEKAAGREAMLRVTFAGQQAEVLDATETTVRVKVPIGAISGSVTVFRAAKAPSDASLPAAPVPATTPSVETPSNSVEFTVTTQFGLYASWHNLQGWSNFDFIEPGMHEPDIVRLEREFMFASRDKLSLPFRDNPLACHWEGKLGVPAGYVPPDKSQLVRFSAYGRLRVSLNGQTRATEAAPGGENDLTTLDFELAGSAAEHLLPLAIDLAVETGPCALRVALMEFAGYEFPDEAEKGDLLWNELRTLPLHFFFPPVVPPSPPVMRNVLPLLPEGALPQPLPFAPVQGMVSIREGQEFELEVSDEGPALLWEQPAGEIKLYCDGVPVPYVVQSATREGNRRTQVLRATLPAGVGEGQLVARMGVVQSAPFRFDVTNKGLIAYLYDLPQPGGYPKVPDLEPLACFAIRKDNRVAFENANEFRLPFPAETFAIEWLGALIVEQEADYILTTRSDDGIQVWLDGNLVVNDDDVHYQREASSQALHLAPGKHQIRVRFFEQNIHEVCVLYWEARVGEQEVLAREVIPARAYTWDEHPPLPDKQSTGKRADGSNPEGG